MATQFAFGKIVTNGLVLSLDAADRNSYPGSGTTWRDLSGNGNTGTLTNGPTFSNNSIVFDGVDDRVQTNYGPQFGDFTTCIWFKPTAITNFGRLIDKSYTNGFWLGRYGSSSTFGGGIKETVDPYGIYLSLSENNWHFLASIRSGTTHILYADGITNTTSNTVTSTLLDSTTIAFGNWSGGTTNQLFTGNIPSIQIYNRALSASEVLQNYNAQKARFGL
jgi:hypothetical protein